MNNVNTYRAVITATIEDVETHYEPDYLEPTQVQSSSTITSHSIIGGDTIADHLIREPDTVTLTGKFTLKGNQSNYKNDIDRLTKIQNDFNQIKNQGIFCKITTSNNINSKSSNRFKEYNNMILNSINWTEGVDSLDFVFTFKEVLVANIQDLFDESVVDKTDEYLPSVGEAVVQNFSDVIIKTDDLVKSTIALMYESGIVDDKFLQNWSKSVTAAGVLIGSGIAIAGTAAIIASIAGAISATGIGAIVVGAAAIIGGIAYGIVKLAEENKVKNLRNKYKKVYRGDTDSNDTKYQEFTEFVSEVASSISETINKYFNVYSISENREQQILLNIDNQYYVFNFVKDNTRKYKYDLKIQNLQDELITGIDNPVELRSAPTNLYELGNPLFKTSHHGYEVYIMNNALSGQDKLNSSDDVTASNTEYANLVNDLTSYYIIVTSTNMSKFKDNITSLIMNHLLKE